MFYPFDALQYLKWAWTLSTIQNMCWKMMKRTTASLMLSQVNLSLILNIYHRSFWKAFKLTCPCFTNIVSRRWCLEKKDDIHQSWKCIILPSLSYKLGFCYPFAFSQNAFFGPLWSFLAIVTKTCLSNFQHC